MKFFDRVKTGINVFRKVEQDRTTEDHSGSSGHTVSQLYRPNRSYFPRVNGNDIMNSIINRIAVDAANVEIRHVQLDQDGRYSKDVKSCLNECLTVEANIDQGARAFRQDIYQTLLGRGEMVIVPTETDDDPDDKEAVDILTMRIGTISQWYPKWIRVSCYDEDRGYIREIELPKSFVAPIINPFYDIMNDQNGTLRRLARKMSLMDAVDEQIGSGKLDLIIQLPYIVKTDTKRTQAEKRRTELEQQLQSSNYGIGYVDGTERITQLNRPIENNLLKNVEALQKQLYDQLGITPEVLNGTASEEQMLNYNVRTLKPLLDEVKETMIRRFLTRTARSQGKSIEYFQNPFALVPVSQLSNLADTLTRNAILSSNEFRDILGYKPVNDPEAEALVNKNMPQPDGGGSPELSDDPDPAIDEMERSFNQMNSALSELTNESTE